MTIVSALAVYFIIWWITLFAILPIRVKTQEEESDVTLGTSESAPGRPLLWWKALITTLVSAALLGLYLLATDYYGLSFDSIPQIVPEFPD